MTATAIVATTGARKRRPLRYWRHYRRAQHLTRISELANIEAWLATIRNTVSTPRSHRPTLLTSSSDSPTSAGPTIAVVELPTPCPTPSEWNDLCLGTWQGPAHDDPVSAWVANRCDNNTVGMPNGDFITVADARALAAALLAAANAAELRQ